MSDPLEALASKDGRAEKLYSVAELAKELGITTRTLRFYEDRGLITPQRAGTARIYSRRDRGRMIIILRGKRLGFSLREIKEYLNLYDHDRTHTEQLPITLLPGMPVPSGIQVEAAGAAYPLFANFVKRGLRTGSAGNKCGKGLR